ncbi:HK97 family phage prohead protease [Mesorhizobium caraganae]|uniref:HK97 family phage prohead protease n=1 Tax=Mesorhizobium caraganae TaxID=483206 RepID=UPI003334C67C
MKIDRVGKGNLTLKPDSIGLWYSIKPNPESPTGQEALATVARADVSQVSVSFSPWIEEWDDMCHHHTRPG